MAIYNASATLTSEAMLCFTRAPKRVLLAPPTRIYRFASSPASSFDGNELFSSPGWFTQTIYQQICRTAFRTGKTTSQVGRARLAIAEPWNPTMALLIVVELTQSVHGWVGPAKPMPLAEDSRAVMLLGNFDQIWVPGLAEPGATSSRAGTLVYYGSASG